MSETHDYRGCLIVFKIKLASSGIWKNQTMKFKFARLQSKKGAYQKAREYYNYLVVKWFNDGLISEAEELKRDNIYIYKRSLPNINEQGVYVAKKQEREEYKEIKQNKERIVLY